MIRLMIYLMIYLMIQLMIQLMMEGHTMFDIMMKQYILCKYVRTKYNIFKRKRNKKRKKESKEEKNYK